MTTFETWLIVTAAVAVGAGVIAQLLARSSTRRGVSVRVALIVIACTAVVAFIAAAGIALVQAVIALLLKAFFASHPLQF